MLEFVKCLKNENGFIPEGSVVKLTFGLTGEQFQGTLTKLSKKELRLVLGDMTVRVFRVDEVEVEIVDEEDEE